MVKRNSFLLLLFCQLQLVAQDTLNYADFIERIKTNHPIIQRANNLNSIGVLDYKSAKGGFDPMLSGLYENKIFDSRNYYSVLDVGIKQPLYASQFISAGYEYAQGSSLNPEDKTPKNGLPFFGLEAALLQGMIIDKRRAELLKAENYLGYYTAEQNRIKNEVLYAASIFYFDWVYAIKELSLNKYFMTLAKQRYQGIKALTEVGENAAVDSIEAFILYQSRYLQMQSVIIEKQKRENELLSQNWLGVNNPTPKRTQLIQPDSLEHYYVLAQALYTKNILDESALVNPEIGKYEAFQKVLEIDKRYKAELIKPKLDLKYNFLGNNPSGNFFNTNNYKWGVNFAMPLFLRASRNDYKISKLNLKNNSLELANKRNELSLKFDIVKQNLLIIQEQLINAEQNARYSQKLLDAEKMKFEQGESSLFLLNTRESRWMDAELKLAEYRIKFIRNVFDLIYLKGDLAYQI